MAPQRWMIHIRPEEETLGRLLSRLRRELGEREGREVTQAEIAERAGMPNLQALISKYELGRVAYPDDQHLARLEDVYGLRRDTLADAVVRTQVQKRRKQQVVPGNAIAVPDEPGIKEVLSEVLELEPEHMPHVAATIRQFREDAARRAQESKD